MLICRLANTILAQMFTAVVFLRFAAYLPIKIGTAALSTFRPLSKEKLFFGATVILRGR